MTHRQFVDLKRLVLPEAVYFVTAKTKHIIPYFRERILGDLFVEELKWCKKIKQFKLFAWFLGYDHFHLLVQPNDEWDISDVMHCLKRHVTRNSNIIMGYAKFPTRIIPSPVGADGHPRLPSVNGINDGKINKTMDIFIIRQRIRFIAKHNNQNPFPKFHWQKSFYDHRIRNEHELDRYWEYIRYNLTKHRMHSHWPFVFDNPQFAESVNLDL